MRVIAGSRRSIPLKTIEGQQVRPTTDRIKETLFNILNPYLMDAFFLDLFSGSGAIGIEALSRGARQAVLVEQNKAALCCIRNNLHVTRLEQEARILSMDVFQALRILEGEKRSFDLIFMDPPYHLGLEEQVLNSLSKSVLVGCNTRIVIESALKTDFSYTNALGFSLDREKCYKTNKHVFLSKLL